MVETGYNNLCFDFWNFTIKLFHLLGFTIELVFGSSILLLDLHLFFGCFLDGSRFSKEPAGIASCHAFETFSGGCILLELKMISFLLIIF